MDGPRVCHIEWIWSEREKQYGILMHIYGIQKRYRWIYLEGRNRNADIDKGCMDPGWKKRVG